MSTGFNAHCVTKPHRLATTNVRKILDTTASPSFKATQILYIKQVVSIWQFADVLTMGTSKNNSRANIYFDGMIVIVVRFSLFL